VFIILLVYTVLYIRYITLFIVSFGIRNTRPLIIKHSIIVNHCFKSIKTTPYMDQWKVYYKSLFVEQ